MEMNGVLRRSEVCHITWADHPHGIHRKSRKLARPTTAKANEEPIRKLFPISTLETKQFTYATKDVRAVGFEGFIYLESE